MHVTVTDWVVFLYNLGAVLSSGYVVMTFNIDDRYLLLGVMIVLAAFWTVYFKLYMRTRLGAVAEGSESR